VDEGDEQLGGVSCFTRAAEPLRDYVPFTFSKMLDGLLAVAEMAATGFDMPPDTFTSKMKYGPHLLAPTGSDLGTFGTLGTVLAGYHYDLNFLTIHGKSRFPGLCIWLRDGTKVLVRVPDGCLLLQAGKQMEYLTGGHVLAGFHEVNSANHTPVYT
jgi:isopenicillin N synthase-like dioxygenase